MQSLSSQVGSGSKSDCLGGALHTSFVMSSLHSGLNCRSGESTAASTNDGGGEPSVAARILLTFTSKKSARVAAEGSGPHVIHDSFGPSNHTTQTASRSVQPFLQCSLL